MCLVLNEKQTIIYKVLLTKYNILKLKNDEKVGMYCIEMNKNILIKKLLCKNYFKVVIKSN